MGSSRLPGKVLMEAIEKPMIRHVVDRVRRCSRLSMVIIATSTHVQDDPLAEYCNKENIPCFRGSEDNVLDRYYHAAKKYRSDVVVRITGDCPLIDPDVITKVIDLFLTGEYDYTSNVFPPTYPDGLDVEVVSMRALETAWKEAVRPMDREHVTCFVSENKDPKRFRKGNVENSRDLSKYRLTVDEERDIRVVRAVLEHFGDNKCTMDQIISFLDANPEILSVNSGIERNEGSKDQYLDPRNQV